MKPVEITDQYEGGEPIVFAKDQPEYDPLPAMVFPQKGMILSEWELTPEERTAIAMGANLRLWVWTFNKPLQPLALGVVGVDE